MPQVTESAAARAALIRDASGVVIGTAWGDTACWNPRRPGSFRAVDEVDGREHVIRCRNCPGCREFEAYCLEKRLQAHYAGVADEIWCIIVDCTLEEQNSLASSLHRRKHLRIEQAHFKLGADAVAFLARGEKPQVPRDVARDRRVQVVRVRKSRGRRAWTVVTAGLRQDRANFGEWVNRFYHRGLGHLDRATKFHFSSRGGITRRHNLDRFARAWKDGVSIHAPDLISIVWSPKRTSYVQRFGFESASATSILDRVVAFAAGAGAQLSPLLPSSHAPRPGGAPIDAAVARRSSNTSPTKLSAILGMGARTDYPDRERVILTRSRYAGSLHSGERNPLTEWLEKHRGRPRGAPG